MTVNENDIWPLDKRCDADDVNSRISLMKQPAEVHDFGMEFADLLNEGDTLDSFVGATVIEGDVTVVQTLPTTGSTRAELTLGGGTHGTDSIVQVQVFTTNGSVRAGNGHLKVRDK